MRHADHGQQDAKAGDRASTELEGIVDTLADKLAGIHGNVSEIYRRVIPPAPAATSAAGPTPVAATYAQKLSELLRQVDQIQAMTGELSGHI
jgi:hypothetical protein